ncbi:oxidative stress defense protein [Gimesia maris]|uniref:SIMPL domain-containing protein n=1 Tax=Gimesia maris TaxID=122 RepID=UPI001189166D|nr:SIMPL domain-containing protein [Gimesia maris]QDU14972.1 oxidative stress defense protein [Gimesia maris]
MSGLSRLLRRVTLFSLAVLFCWIMMTHSSTAAENQGITVMGLGSVEAKPSVVELTGIVIGQGQLAGDAVTKFHGNRRRAETAFKNLKIPGLEVVEEGLSLYSSLNASQMQAMMRGMAVNNTDSQELSVSETLKLRVTGIDKLSSQELLEMIVRIVDSGKDAGVIIGNDTSPSVPGTYNPSKARNTMATFKVTDVEKLKEAAYEQAVKDARSQAEKLAKLTGVKLGKVISVDGVGDSQKNTAAIYNQIISQYMAATGVNQTEEQASTLLKAIPIAVAVRVTYSIE